MNLRLAWLNVAKNPEVRLHNWRGWIIAAQLLWLTLAVLGVVALLQSVSISFELYQQPCSAPGSNTCLLGQFSTHQLEHLHNSGLSIRLIATLLISLILLERLFELTVSALLIWRRPDNRAAVLWSFVILTCGIGAPDYTTALPQGHWLQVILAGAWMFNGLALMPAFISFPNGHFQPRWSIWLALGATLSSTLSFYLFPWITSHPPAETLFTLLNAVLMLTVLGVLIYRYRRVFTLAERQQVKLVIYGFSVAMGLSLIYSVLSLLIPALNVNQNGLAALFRTLLGFLGLFISFGSIGLSILYHHLFDIDLIINRTLVYVSLTAIIIGIYIGIVSVLAALFRNQGDPVTSLLATGAVAVIFQPVRQQLQYWINRLMFGERDNPYAVLSRLGQQLKTILTPQAMLLTMTETVATALKLPYAAISLAQDDGFNISAMYGKPVSDPVILPLVYQNEVVGQLIVAPRTPGEVFSMADRRLLEDIAHQAGAMAQAVQLTADLRRSRERLVTAREEERRRLRRDLHDGLGPTLASQTLKLDTAIDLLTDDPEIGLSPNLPRAIQLLESLKGQTQATVADIRRLIYELRPPALDDLGLVAALQSNAAQISGASSELYITVETPAEGLPSLSAAVEVAAYRIALEAVTNVARHAQARTCTIRLSSHHNGRLALQVDVIDDGAGLPAQIRSGVGFSSMRERAAELGGTCTIENRPIGGTHLIARLPLPEAAS
jgi:signal transduction histidine kinase